MALELGCKVGAFPSSHLGLCLGAPYKSVVVWDGVDERFRKRLVTWKRQYMPIYVMSLLCIPRVVRLRLKQIQKDFLWGEGALVRKPHLVKWVVVCLDKSKGVLGVRCLSILNRALLCK